MKCVPDLIRDINPERLSFLDLRHLQKGNWVCQGKRGLEEEEEEEKNTFHMHFFLTGLFSLSSSPST